MNEDKKEKSFFDKLEEKWKVLPMWKKTIAILLYLTIFVSIGWQIYDLQDVVATTTITITYNYDQECQIVYVDSVLQELNTTCPDYIVQEYTMTPDERMKSDFEKRYINYNFTNFTI